MESEHVAGNLYLDLLKKALLASIYDENGWYVLGSLESRRPSSLKERMKAFVVDHAWKKGLLIVKPRSADAEKANWGLFCYTMIGLARLDNIQACVEDVIRNGVPGDLIETGVWRGGATIFMRGVLKAHGVTDRTVWVADSFEGLPKIDAAKATYKDDAAVDVATLNEGGPMGLALAVPLERVQENFRKFGLLDEQVRFLKGWFSQTLPSAAIESIAVLRLDGDMYESTMDALNALYSKVSPGGYVIVDDYNCWPHCKRAVDDYRARNGIGDKLITIDDAAVYWQVSPNGV